MRIGTGRWDHVDNELKLLRSIGQGLGGEKECRE